MKVIFKLSIILFFSVLPFFSSALTTDSLSVTLLQVKNSEDPGIPEPADKGRRTPPRPVECTIARTTGVSIQNVAPEDILLFEIYDESGICVGAFSDAESFTDFFFSRPGAFEVRFHTSQHVFRGYTSL